MVTNESSHIARPYILVLILLLAFWLRVNGLDFGLPYVFHDDEHQYVEAGIAFLQNREATLTELEKLNNPPLFKMSLGGFYVLMSRLLIGDPQAIETALADEQWRTFFHYLGRLVSASIGLLTVAALYALGRRLYRQRIGLVGALLLAVSFLHVRESHFAVNDAPLTLLAVVTLYTSAGILRLGRWFDYVVTGLLVGLAVATKYTGIYLAVVLIVAHWLRYLNVGRSRHARPNSLNWSLKPSSEPSLSSWLSWLLSPRWLVGLGLIPVGFIIGAPVALTAWPEMIRRMGRLAEYGRFGYHDLLLAPYTGWIFYLRTLAWGAGFLLLAVCVLALLAVLIYRTPEDLLLVASPALLYVMMARQQMVFVRFILPALPPLLLLAAIWLERFSGFIAGLNPHLKRRWLLPAATAVLVFQPLVWSIWFGIVLSQPDTRELAADWVANNIPEGTVIYNEEHALPRNGVTGRVSWPHVQLEELSFDEPDPLGHYRQRGAQFILTSDFHHQRRFSDAAKETGRQDWVSTLASLPVVVEFQPYWRPAADFAFDQRYGPWFEAPLRSLPGPIVRVYQIDPPPNWHSLNPFSQANQLLDKASVFGYQLIPEQGVQPGETVKVILYWLNRGWQPSDDRLLVSLMDGAGFEIAQTSAEPMPEFAGALQRGDKIIKSEAKLLIPAGTPPGSYHLNINAYDQNKLQTLGTVALSGPAVTAPASAANITDGLSSSGGTSLAPGLSLTSYELVVDDSAMDNTLVLDQDNWFELSWRATRDMSLDYTIQLTLLDSQEKVVAAWEGQPVHGQYATSNWQAGQFIRDPWNLRLAGDAIQADVDAEEAYQLVLTLRDPENRVVGTQPLGTMRISSRERNSAIPAMQRTLNRDWVDHAFRLLGFNIRAVPDSSDSGWLELDLYWQSLSPVDTDYLIGLRLVDAQGQVVLAQDSQPDGGQAPISTWQPGEVVHDFHSLRYESLDMENRYRLELSLLDPQTGKPLLAGETESLLLTSWP